MQGTVAGIYAAFGKCSLSAIFASCSSGRIPSSTRSAVSFEVQDKASYGVGCHLELVVQYLSSLCAIPWTEWEKTLQLLGVIGIGQVFFSIFTIYSSVWIIPLRFSHIVSLVQKRNRWSYDNGVTLWCLIEGAFNLQAIYTRANSYESLEDVKADLRYCPCYFCDSYVNIDFWKRLMTSTITPLIGWISIVRTLNTKIVLEGITL